MSDFSLYFTLGHQHITNLNGLDHILFLVALCIRYQFNDWKQLLIVVTLFTVGHAVTQALSTSGFITLPARWIELLVALITFTTAVSNLFVKKIKVKTRFPVMYGITLFFGLIHGLGFSFYFKNLTDNGSSIFVQLLAFSLGVEAGQILVVAIILGVSMLCLNVLKFNRREYMVFLSGGVIVAALQMVLQRWLW